jgi:hypothetical protein
MTYGVADEIEKNPRRNLILKNPVPETRLAIVIYGWCTAKERG